MADLATTQRIPANNRGDIQLVAEGDVLSPANGAPLGVVGQDAQWKTDQLAVRSRLTEYLINHNEYASAVSVREGLLPQVRVVGYDSGE